MTAEDNTVHRVTNPSEFPDGKIKKIAISTYLITPYNVDVVGDLVEELENNGMYF